MKRLMTLLLALTLPAVLFSTVQPAAASWAGIEYFYNFNDSLKPFRFYSDHSAPSTTDTVIKPPMFQVSGFQDGRT